jgi:iron-sulfur cluster repair protein YtfE (RIC family)
MHMSASLGGGNAMSWLKHDHRAFELVVWNCCTACDAGDWDKVRRLADELASAYASHVRIEEEVLFPAYEGLPGVPPEPTASLKLDHAQIFRLISLITGRLKDRNHATLAEDFASLYRKLARHHEKEEEIFLPMASEALEGDKDYLLGELQRNLEIHPGKYGVRP